MKFYEVKQRTSNLQWFSLGFFRTEKDAERYRNLYNTQIMVYPTRIEEHEFKNVKDFEDGFKG